MSKKTALWRIWNSGDPLPPLSIRYSNPRVSSPRGGVTSPAHRASTNPYGPSTTVVVPHYRGTAAFDPKPQTQDEENVPDNNRGPDYDIWAELPWDVAP